MAIGRPSDFTPEIAEEICERLAKDESLASICRDDGMPGLTTVFRWRDARPDFRADYARARENQGHTVADTVGEIRHALLRGEIDAATATAAGNLAKWEASRRASRDFGDKIAHVGGGDDDSPIRTRADLSGLTVEQLRVLASIPGG